MSSLQLHQTKARELERTIEFLGGPCILRDLFRLDCFVVLFVYAVLSPGETRDSQHDIQNQVLGLVHPEGFSTLRHKILTSGFNSEQAQLCLQLVSCYIYTIQFKARRIRIAVEKRTAWLRPDLALR